MLAENDDTGGFQSEIEVGGLDAGTYYVAVAEFFTVFSFGFVVESDGDSGGDFTLNYNGNTLDGNIAKDTVQFYSFVVGGTEPTIVRGDSLDVTRGSLNMGGLAELADSDNADLSIFRATSDVLSRTEFEVMGVSPTDTPTMFDVTLEGSVFARNTVNQSIDLWDFDVGEWEEVDTQEAMRFSDLSLIHI